MRQHPPCQDPSREPIQHGGEADKVTPYCRLHESRPSICSYADMNDRGHIVMCGSGGVMKKAPPQMVRARSGRENYKRCSVTPFKRFPSIKAFDYRHKSMWSQRHHLTPQKNSIAPHAISLKHIGMELNQGPSVVHTARSAAVN